MIIRCLAHSVESTQTGSNRPTLYPTSIPISIHNLFPLAHFNGAYADNGFSMIWVPASSAALDQAGDG